MAWDPYATDTTLVDNLFGGRSEPNMREEFNNTMDGRWPEISKARPVILRKKRRDNTGALVPCACVSPLTGEADVDTWCPFCWGSRYYWDESFVDTYKIIVEGDTSLAVRESMVSPGLLNIPLVIFYMRSSVDITQDDEIVEITLDNEGNPTRPYRRIRLYRIESVVDFRADQGKLEYWKIGARLEDRKYLNGANL